MTALKIAEAGATVRLLTRWPMIGMDTAPDVYLHWMLTYVHQSGIELICDRFVQLIDGTKVTVFNVYNPQDTRVVAPEREVRLSASGPVWLLADPEQLRQLLANLTRNAVMHTPAGTTVELRVRLEPDWLVMEVADNGPGLPAGDPARQMICPPATRIAPKSL